MLCWCSFAGCGRACVSVFFDHYGAQYIQNSQQHTNVNIWRLTVAYRNVTTNSETRHAQPEIGTDPSSLTQQTLRVDGYGSRFTPPRDHGSGFWSGHEPNRPGFGVQTRTAGTLAWSVANTSLMKCGGRSMSALCLLAWLFHHTVREQVSRCCWRPQLCELGGNNQASL